MKGAGLAAAVLAAAALLSFRPIYEPDLWWHLAQGRQNAAGDLVRTNLFSFTYPEHRQRFTSWLFDTAAYGAWQSAGPAGIQALQSALIAAALGLVVLAARRRGASAASTFAVLLLVFVALEPRAIPRPHLVSYVGLAAIAFLIEASASRGSARPLLAAVPLVALWSNFHVECVFGVHLIGLFGGAEAIWPARLPRAEGLRAVGLAALGALATAANPYGWGLISYLYENLSVPRILTIAELLPPQLPMYRAFYSWLVIACAAALLPPSRFAPSDALITVVFGAFGLMHLRETPLVVLATAPLVAHRLTMLLGRGLDYRALVVTTACAAWVLSRIPAPFLISELTIGREAVEPAVFFSRGAIEFARTAGLRGPVFNSHNLGGHLAWTMYPEVRVFQDSRLQAYPPEHFSRIITASRSQPEWEALVAGVDWAMVSVRRPNQLSGAGRFPEPTWRSVYQDDAVEIVVRRAGKYGLVRR